jgi:hypothetical protein
MIHTATVAVHARRLDVNTACDLVALHQNIQVKVRFTVISMFVFENFQSLGWNKDSSSNGEDSVSSKRHVS